MPSSSDWNLSDLRRSHTSLARPVVWYLFCMYWQAVEGNSWCLVTLVLSGLRAFKELLVVFLPKISPRQRPEWRRSRVSSFSHSLRGEGGHRWRYIAPTWQNTATILQQQSFFIMITRDAIQPSFVPARKLSLVGGLPGANVKSYAGYLTVNKQYNSNLFFWFFPALMVGSRFFFFFFLTTWTFQFTGFHAAVEE